MIHKVFAAVFVMLFMLSPVAPDQFVLTRAAAQEVPVMGPNGWELPANDGDSFIAGPTSRPTQQATQYSGGYGYSSLVEQWRSAVQAACYYEGCEERLMRIINCESGGDHSAVGPNGEIGILQFHPYGTWGAVSDPYVQIQIAAEAFATGLGYNWVCQ